ncbi:hypothetical protein D3C71_1962650 [compost metagenome]
MTVGQVGFDGTGVAVFLRVVAVGLEHVEVEEIHAPFVAAGMAKLVDLLLDFLVHGRFAEVLAVAKADEGVAPVGCLAGSGERAQGDCGQYLANAFL